MKLIGTFFSAVLLMLNFSVAFSQGYWQQRISYQMEVDMDVQTHRFTGKQQATYTNNSPDTLYRVFYHLYFNAFQPGSMMDVRSRTITDPDRRVGDRIYKLKPEEIGYLRVKSLNQNGKAVRHEEVGTILEVELDKPILPGKSATFEMQFEGQVPVQIRRSGRDSEEGIAYSMAQWYPKMCEFDHMGWHANPYIGREFHGVWGDFDVKITIDSAYTLGGTGYLQNPEQIGHGYLKPGQKLNRPKGDKLTWHFIAPDVHDFMWAADPEYKHVRVTGPNGMDLHFFYRQNSNTVHWEKLPEYTIKAFELMNKRFGQYPYKQYSVVQGGDGGMEYPMATLITGHRSLTSLVGVTVHELVHSWFQMLLGTNESLYAWMDEGFTSYATDIVMEQLFGSRSNFPLHYGSYANYFALVESGLEEPLSTHADHFNTNRAYGVAAYSKGAVFLHQLSYVIGQPALDRGMLRYFNEWKYKHPTPNDFIRVMEKVSGLELDWYKEYWVYTTKTIDYAVESLKPVEGGTQITLRRVGDMIMPVEVLVGYADGKQELFYAPLQIMRGRKPHEYADLERVELESWPWVYPTYEFVVPVPITQIENVIIDPSNRTADVNRENNVYKRDPRGIEYKGKPWKREKKQ